MQTYCTPQSGCKPIPSHGVQIYPQSEFVQLPPLTQDVCRPTPPARVRKDLPSVRVCEVQLPSQGAYRPTSDSVCAGLIRSDVQAYPNQDVHRPAPVRACTGLSQSGCVQTYFSQDVYRPTLSQTVCKPTPSLGFVQTYPLSGYVQTYPQSGCVQSHPQSGFVQTYRVQA
jgi:hypothetical protein